MTSRLSPACWRRCATTCAPHHLVQPRRAAKPDRKDPARSTRTRPGLIATASGLTDEQVGEPSLLPGWTRGHVLIHIARAAEAHRNLLEAVRTGSGIPAYASQEARDTSIENGASRPSRPS
ncbi:maleylpyruvate isomerase N-terminal domain-containing protein [Streptomyces rapamycinicus]|uniref:maleylpyruvate isomerase N-terminal domain-containing protein n=1 Tax=Streptomyces rapamycinicus TaxID=1226757 RepID=UPI002852EECC|nr:maleylpyruvate isomerase N-terminal domain-containing protein [Streptomyces rapamycinicus]